MITLSLVDPSRPHWREAGAPRPVETVVFVPTGPGPHPVVLLSHGTGGEIADLAWFAEGLAAAGYLVAGVNHHGNTAREPYDPRGFVRWWDRPLDMSVALDGVLARYAADPARIMAAGFSLGGYTAVALAGARMSAAAYAALAASPEDAPPTPEYPDLDADLRAIIDEQDFAGYVAECGRDVRDRRVRAAYLMAPSGGPMLDPDSVARIGAPVRVVWGDADDILPPEAFAKFYLATVPDVSGRSLGAEVGHYDFVRGTLADVVVPDAVTFLAAG
ncbi:alpha/beta hydrolase family protein [Longispora albida]|uniref:alpha/beta hydrolase family protein n=1 Tax=Longispora albida TaxID=203523 RepID=UPI00039CC455|nr:alpha/beta hydrolase [Longispora albida]